MERVVITGIGLVTPNAIGTAESWRSIVEGQPGIARITLFDATTFPTQFAAQVKNFDLSRYVRDAGRWANAGSNSRFAAAAAQQALEDAGVLDGAVDRTRFGVYLGSGEGIQDFHNFVSLVGDNYQADSRSVDPAVAIIPAVRLRSEHRFRRP